MRITDIRKISIRGYISAHLWIAGEAGKAATWCTDTSDPGHFGPKTLRTCRSSDPGHFGMTEVSGHFGTGAEVSYGHFGTGAEVS